MRTLITLLLLSHLEKVLLVVAHAAKYKGVWNSPPRRIESGTMPDAPILGNGDLGISVGANLHLGELVIHLGLNQMWGMRTYNKQIDPTPHLDAATKAFPRRLGIGGISIRANEVIGGTFSAQQHLDIAEVHASISSCKGNISIRIFLSPDENVAITEITTAVTRLNITSWVHPANGWLNSTGHLKSSSRLMEKLDGVVSAGVDANAIWSLRQPLGLQSPMPIRVATATHVIANAPTVKSVFTSTLSSASVHLDIGRNDVLRLATALVSNWDMCDTVNGCADPLNTAVQKAVAFDKIAVLKLEARNKEWWSHYWSSTSISMPGDPILEQFYYAHSYLIASASRRGTTTGAAAGLWGPWVHSDNPKWNGGFTVDYNFQASYWGLYAMNRLEQAWPHYKPILDFLPKAKSAASYYKCPGLHFPGVFAAFGFDGSFAGEPWADMSDHSNGVFLALNMIQHWEYYQDISFLRDIAYPFARDVLSFYQCWMTRRPDGSWINTMDQSNECFPKPPTTIESLKAYCYQNNSITANGFIRRVAGALPSMALALNETVDPAWKEIALKMDDLPVVTQPGLGDVFVYAGNYTLPPLGDEGCYVGPISCGTRQSGCASCGPLLAGEGAFVTWPVFPAESVSLASPEHLQRISRNTLIKSNSWAQGNSFSSIFSQAARVAMPVEQWLHHLHETLKQLTMPNLVVYQDGGGLEVAGALQFVADMMLQSVTSPDASGHHYIALFPLNITHTDMKFQRLRAKGGFIISASWMSSTQTLGGPIHVHSTVGGQLDMQLPAQEAVQEVIVLHQGKEVSVIQTGGRFAFQTRANQDYLISLKSRTEMHLKYV